MAFKTKKVKKTKGQRGHSTYGHGARKKWKGSGHHGGCGMAGTGKRADHKKSLVIKLYGNNYFGKQGITSRGTAHKVNDVLNLSDIQSNFSSLMKTFGKENELVLECFKILGEGEFTEKITIKARAFSESAKSKIEKAGGKAIVLESETRDKAPKKESELVTKKSDAPKKVATDKKPKAPVNKK